MLKENPWKVISIVKNNFIGCYVDDEELKKIQNNVKKYGYSSISEYIRSTLDYFDARRYNASKNNEISIISDCIKLLSDHKKSVQKTMLNESLKNFDENLKGQKSEKGKTLKDNDENLKGNLKENEDRTLKNIGENLKGQSISSDVNPDKIPAEVIQTLIRLTHVKGKPSDDDFQFQASRCHKKKKEIIDYYTEHYSFFVEESDKYH